MTKPHLKTLIAENPNKYKKPTGCNSNAKSKC